MSEIEQTLNDRSAKYGDYSTAVHVRASIMRHLKNFHRAHTGAEMEEEDANCIIDIVGKLCRIAATPNHIDSWHDVAGYATNIENYYKGKLNADQ